MRWDLALTPPMAKARFFLPWVFVGGGFFGLLDRNFGDEIPILPDRGLRLIPGCLPR